MHAMKNERKAELPTPGNFNLDLAEDAFAAAAVHREQAPQMQCAHHEYTPAVHIFKATRMGHAVSLLVCSKILERIDLWRQNTSCKFVVHSLH
eukprot:5585110-Pyramimonas_sp.AAC.4